MAAIRTVSMVTVMESAAKARQHLVQAAVSLAAAALLLACQPATVRPTDVGRATDGGSATSLPTPALTARPSASIAPSGPVQQADVVSVTDGDTIEVRLDGGRRETVRYIGIDTPEPRANGGPEPFAAEATRANERLVSGQTIYLESDSSNTDRFGRLLRYAWLQTADGGWLMVNLQLVREGLAEARTYEPDTQWQAILDAAERQAQADGLGIWGASAQPTPVGIVGGGCDPAYPDVCIAPPPPDLDCPQIPQRRFRVLPPDPHGFDLDFDGIGCEFLGTP